MTAATSSLDLRKAAEAGFVAGAGADRPARTLTIVVPAYNEEEAIGATIKQCLAARPLIQREADLDEVEVIVVSDGSTDRTVEIARGFADVKVIVFPENRGYGAAIKAGFAEGSGGLLAFLDADGTCDPRFFAVLCRTLEDAGTDIALGSRLGANSKMPRVRRIGNHFFAAILGVLCGQSVTDTASGMRVIRRSAIARLNPLPNGLHFTPAMSARALLSGMKISEIPMAYDERVGQSKLRLVKDSVRFLKAIIEGVLWFRPERLFLAGFAVCFLLALLLAAYPTEFYLRESRLEEWMIYRFITCFLLGTAGFVLLAAGTVAHRFVLSANDHGATPRFWPCLFEQLFTGWTLIFFVGVHLLVSAALVWSGAVQFLNTGHVDIHWSRVIVSAFGFLIAFIATVTGTLLQVIKVRSRGEALELLAPVIEGPESAEADRLACAAVL
jgi:glycosyltransferase involved in cell wall biosynthesis